MGHLEYEGEVYTGRPKPYVVEENDALHASRYMSTEAPLGLTQGEEKNVKMAENTGVENKKGKVL